MQACYDNGIFWLNQVPDQKLSMLRESGWAYDEDRNAWGTRHADIAAEWFPKGSDSISLGVLDAYRTKEWNSRLALPNHMTASEVMIRAATPRTQTLRKYQEAGIAALIQDGNKLLADDMGLGKTIQAIVACNVLEPLKTLIVCPAAVKENWRNELEKWSTLHRTYSTAYGRETLSLEAQTIIINYDIFKDHIHALQEVEWDMVIIDEAQYLKTMDTQRTLAVLGTVKQPTLKAKKIIAMTGTPITNMPRDLYPVLKRLDYYGWGNLISFGRQFCGGHWENRRVRGGEVIKTWIDTGSTQPEKLQDRLRSTIMVRRVKSDALPELPAKIRQIISLEPDTKTAKLLKTERGLVQKSDLTYAEYTELAQTLTGEVPGFQDMARIRREIGIIKMRIALPHLNEVIENNDKVIIFAHHVEIIQRLMIEFGYKATGIYGAVPPKQRVKNIYNFQNDPDKRVFVGNIKAAGVGINLTAASVVIFLEHAWTPDATNQAEDRAHRMGQKDTVHVQHLVLKDSLDSYMVRTIIRKQEMIDKIINQKKEEENGSTD